MKNFVRMPKGKFAKREKSILGRLSSTNLSNYVPEYPNKYFNLWRNKLLWLSKLSFIKIYLHRFLRQNQSIGFRNRISMINEARRFFVFGYLLTTDLLCSSKNNWLLCTSHHAYFVSQVKVQTPQEDRNQNWWTALNALKCKEKMTQATKVTKSI